VQPSYGTVPHLGDSSNIDIIVSGSLWVESTQSMKMTISAGLVGDLPTSHQPGLGPHNIS
jgi:hypothetical protein